MMGYHFFFIKIPNLANICNSVHDRNFEATLEQVSMPRPPYANSLCQCRRPLTSAPVLASVYSLPIASKYAEHLAKAAYLRIVVPWVLYFFKCE